MDRIVIVLLGSALGAAGAVLAVQALAPPSPRAETTEALPSDLAARLERIEAKLDDRPEPLTLRGNAPAPTPLGLDLGSPEGKAFLKAIGDTVKAETRETLSELREEGGEALSAPPPTRPKKKRMALSDVARELELSSSEESALRDHYDKITNKALKLLAGDDGNVDEVKADLESIKEDPSKRMVVFSKYMPRIFPKKMAEFIQLRTDVNAGVVEAVGSEKAAKINDGYVIEESDPFGFGSGGGMGMRGR